MDMVVVHYSESPDVSAATIDAWHRERDFTPRGSNPLKYIGYHFVVHPDGKVEAGRSTDVQGTHCPGYNIPGVLAICLTGSDSLPWYPTPAQYLATATLIKQYGVSREAVWFHRELYDTSCPGRLDKQTLLSYLDQPQPKGDGDIMLPSPISLVHVFPDIWVERFNYWLHIKNESQEMNKADVIVTRRDGNWFHLKTAEPISPYADLNFDLKAALAAAGINEAVCVTVRTPNAPSACYVREF